MVSMKVTYLLLIVLFSMVFGEPAIRNSISDDELKAREEALVEQRKAVENLRIERMKLAEGISKEVEELLKEVEEIEKEGGIFKTPFQRGKKCKDLSPAELFVQAATDGVGECKLQVTDDDDHRLCWIYLKAAEKDVFGDRGFPKQLLPDGTLAGSGCVFARDGPKPQEGCIYRLRHVFSLEVDDVWRLCQPFGYFNGFSQLKLALRRNACGNISC